MSNRLTKIITRGGDKGATSLGDGSRIAKDDFRIDLIGQVDELNSWIGVVLSQDPSTEIADLLLGVQHDLFDLGGALSLPGKSLLSEQHVGRIDAAAAKLNAGLSPLKEFILPGGEPILAWLHIARTVCRRTERAITTFNRQTAGGNQALAYLNRLSDYLFIAARYEARHRNISETLWKKASSIEPT